MPRRRKQEDPDPWADLMDDPEKVSSLAEEFRAQQERLSQTPTFDIPGSRFD